MTGSILISSLKKAFKHILRRMAMTKEPTWTAMEAALSYETKYVFFFVILSFWEKLHFNFFSMFITIYSEEKWIMMIKLDVLGKNLWQNRFDTNAIYVYFFIDLCIL